MAFKKVNEVAGVPLHYARTQAHPYGTRGLQRTFLMEPSFYTTLEACFTETFAACPLGKPEAITTAGTFVNKPGSHGRGTAFDFDAAFWSSYTLVTTSFPANMELYLGIESFLRRHFGIVLNYHYNDAHKDHWHIDNSVRVNFNKSSRSKVIYLQLTLKHIYRIDVVVDGLFGPQTDAAYKRTTKVLALNADYKKATWLKYLDLTGRVAFELFRKKNNPRGLLDNLHQLILDQPMAQRHTLLETFNAFQYHPDTVAWVGQMKSGDKKLEAAIKAVLK